jgi:hypothetical protein
MKDACIRAIDEFNMNVTKSAVEKHWRKLWNTLDESYTVIHICGDNINETSYNMLISYIYITLAKLMFGYLYNDVVLYGEYLLKVFKPSENKNPIDILEEIHKRVIDKNDTNIEDIQKYVIRLLSAIINYIYTPY